jgi:hypothetical protein
VVLLDPYKPEEALRLIDAHHIQVWTAVPTMLLRIQNLPGRALDLDVVSMAKIAAMLGRATENAEAPPPRAASGLAPARFARDASEYRTSSPKPAKPDWMTVIDGGALDDDAQEQLW